MHRIVFIITYMGKYPWYFPYFLHSCRYNPTIDFLIFTDNNDLNIDLPANVKIIPNSLEQFKADAAQALGFDVAVQCKHSANPILRAKIMMSTFVGKKSDGKKATRISETKPFRRLDPY